MTVFQRNIPVPMYMGPVLGRSSYIDDIAHGAPTWDQLCDDLNALLFRLRYWNISGVQSFMGSLNYYNKFTLAKEAFELLKRKIVSTSQTPGPNQTVCYHPTCEPLGCRGSFRAGVRWSDSSNPVHGPCPELRYHIAEKEVIAILRVLENFRALVESSPVIVVYTRYSVLKWLLTSNSADGRNVNCRTGTWKFAGSSGLPAILGAGITPREHLDEVSENLIPAKGRVKPPAPVSVEMLEANYQGHVLSFDGAPKTSTRLGRCRCILWKLP
ncbi:Hypothetical protein PHPALM_11252, partial [Phytophthora palmivora]